MEYNFRETEKKWQELWAARKTFRALNPGDAGFDSKQHPYYVLDMFPYPSGAGLHVGHPLGYIASDIFARYKRQKGFNVLHPMGYDSFGLPAEQYAIQTGQHPADTTEKNISRYREQLDKIGFSFDWDREVRTADPAYYKWTQWIFLKLFHSWYNTENNKAELIETLIEQFKSGERNFGDAEKKWDALSEREQSDILMEYRLAFVGEATVNWCPALGTVLANDEVKDGVSERGGYPVERKRMKQWSLRITNYAQRLLDDLDAIDWSESIKEQQRNWIGRSEGASVRFRLAGMPDSIEVFTTRPDTIFGATFMTLAPEHELVEQITVPERKKEVQQYVTEAGNRSERERMAEVKNITGVFTGAFAEHPFTKENIPVWIGDYVLAGYGTGAVMAVPAHDERDHAFAKHFGLEIKQVIEAPAGWDILEKSFDSKENRCIHSDFLNGLEVKDALKKIIAEIEKRGLGKGKVNFRLRDAVFGRQRYWGEPIPVYYKDGIACPVDEKDLPVILPEVDKYLPTADGEPPLARAEGWKYNGYAYETTTMPGWAGSSWYYLRYMDAHNDREFVSREAADYWQNVDLYIGGSEHATGHLLYVRFWTKFLYDLGLIGVQEPAKKLVNQGMIQGTSSLVYRIQHTNKFVSTGLKNRYDTTALHADVNMVRNNELDIAQFRQWREEFATAEFELENGKYICGSEVEKMSKRWHNVVNPDDIIQQHGADAFRMYEMFLGPLELSKPWNTNGITGVSNFIRKLWRMFHADGNFAVNEEAANKKELKSLHKLIRKVSEDLERLSFNTSVSNFMICVNELTELKCNKRDILTPLVIALSPFAPHVTEELWQRLGHAESISKASFPLWKEEYLTEDSFAYPISVNGKTRLNLELALSLNKEEVEKEVLSSDEVKKYLQGNHPKKVIVVPGRIVNIVL
jgi:leucyl-tRNA synthetase